MQAQKRREGEKNGSLFKIEKNIKLVPSSSNKNDAKKKNIQGELPFEYSVKGNVVSSRNNSPKMADTFLAKCNSERKISRSVNRILLPSDTYRHKNSIPSKIVNTKQVKTSILEKKGEKIDSEINPFSIFNTFDVRTEKRTEICEIKYTDLLPRNLAHEFSHNEASHAATERAIPKTPDFHQIKTLKAYQHNNSELKQRPNQDFQHKLPVLQTHRTLNLYQNTSTGIKVLKNSKTEKNLHELSFGSPKEEETIKKAPPQVPVSGKKHPSLVNPMRVFHSLKADEYLKHVEKDKDKEREKILSRNNTNSLPKTIDEYGSKNGINTGGLPHYQGIQTERKLSRHTHSKSHAHLLTTAKRNSKFIHQNPSYQPIHNQRVASGDNHHSQSTHNPYAYGHPYPYGHPNHQHHLSESELPFLSVQVPIPSILPQINQIDQISHINQLSSVSQNQIQSQTNLHGNSLNHKILSNINGHSQYFKINSEQSRDADFIKKCGPKRMKIINPRSNSQELLRMKLKRINKKANNNPIVNSTISSVAPLRALFIPQNAVSARDSISSKGNPSENGNTNTNGSGNGNNIEGLRGKVRIIKGKNGQFFHLNEFSGTKKRANTDVSEMLSSSSRKVYMNTKQIVERAKQNIKAMSEDNNFISFKNH